MDDQDYEDCLKTIPFHEGKKQLEEVYVYQKEIGKGAYGYVMCGYRLKDHCSVAIKVIPTGMISEWYYSKTLNRKIPLEVLLLVLTRKIEGVVSIIEFYEDVELKEWYIVMERFIKTIDLFEYINSMEYLKEDVACCILYQLMIIIIDCHILGVVHRDIKEENILIDPNTKKVWLIDFGSGSLMRDDNHTTYNGTLAYSSPEWLLYRHYRGCQLESWTLGIVLYSMVCGCIPFEDEEQILSGVVRFPRKLSTSCTDLILRCLERDPEKRIQPYEMITFPWVLKYRGIGDSGNSSFDEAFVHAPARRKCSCNCGENLSCSNREELAAIETVSYDQDCIKEIDPELHFKIISKSLSPDNNRKKYLLSSKDRDETLESSNLYKSMPQFDDYNFSSQFLLKKQLSINEDEDCGYEEDIDDNFQLEVELWVISNEESI